MLEGGHSGRVSIVSKYDYCLFWMFTLDFSAATQNHFLYYLTYYDTNNVNNPHFSILFAHNKNFNNFYYNIISSSKRSQYNNNYSSGSYYITNIIIEKDDSNVFKFYAKLNTIPSGLYCTYKIFDLSNSFNESVGVYNNVSYIMAAVSNTYISINLQ